MTDQQLTELIRMKRSFLCVGLDTDPAKVPPHLSGTDDPVFEFNKTIIDATHEFAVAYKPNSAFYEAHGIKGWSSLEKTIKYLSGLRDTIFTIADAKRGDIGNTSESYARAFLADPPDGLGFDAITVAPYMGFDSVRPFLNVRNKWVILLALTSNPGSNDFQQVRTENGKYLFERVIETSVSWGTHENMMYVVGATKAEMLQGIRRLLPQHYLLVPGVGAQGGSLEEVARYGMNGSCGLLVNSSRGIIYSSSGPDFARKARDEAQILQKTMERLLLKHRVI